MSLTPEARRLHDEYSESNLIIQCAVDEAYDAVRQVFVDEGFDVANSDAAEELVAHIYKYLIDSAEPTKKADCAYCPFGNVGYTVRCIHCGRFDTPPEAA